MKLTPHFTFDGQSEEALNFYSTALNGKIVTLIRFSDLENGCCGATEMKPEEGKRILNGCLQFGENSIYCCDQMPGQKPTQGNNVMMDITLADKAEIQRVFDALADGGNVIMPLAPAAWTPLYGMVIDRYGIYWNIMQQ